MSQLTVAKALTFYGFRTYRAGDEPAWPGDAVVLVCSEVSRGDRAEPYFRILHAYKLQNDAAQGATVMLDPEQWSDCAPSSLFALVGAVPEGNRAVLLTRIQDAIAVRRHFEMPRK